MTKLAIIEEREEDKYDHLTSLKCWSCDPQDGVELSEAKNDPKLRIIAFRSIHHRLTKKKSFR
jgi:ubiquitin carboxyl-terminal hydrolase 5/13